MFSEHFSKSGKHCVSSLPFIDPLHFIHSVQQNQPICWQGKTERKGKKTVVWLFESLWRDSFFSWKRPSQSCELVAERISFVASSPGVPRHTPHGRSTTFTPPASGQSSPIFYCSLATSVSCSQLKDFCCSCPTVHVLLGKQLAFSISRPSSTSDSWKHLFCPPNCCWMTVFPETMQLVVHADVNHVTLAFWNTQILFCNPWCQMINDASLMSSFLYWSAHSSFSAKPISWMNKMIKGLNKLSLMPKPWNSQ